MRGRRSRRALGGCSGCGGTYGQIVLRLLRYIVLRVARLILAQRGLCLVRRLVLALLPVLAATALALPGTRALGRRSSQGRPPEARSASGAVRGALGRAASPLAHWPAGARAAAAASRPSAALLHSRKGPEGAQGPAAAARLAEVLLVPGELARDLRSSAGSAERPRCVG